MAKSALRDTSWGVIEGSTFATDFVMGEVLAELAEDHPNVCVLTADLGYPTRVREFAARHPDRFFDFGIAEHNMVSAAAGMATAGKIPYVTTFACFVGLLCCEQLRTDIAYPGLPVRVLATHGGISMGFYGTSHHATEDLAIVRSIAGMTIVSTADRVAIRATLRRTVDDPGPIYFRLGRGREPVIYTPDDPRYPFAPGKSHRLRTGNDVSIIATGSRVHPALQAAELLTAAGIDAAVIDMWCIKPLDAEAIEQAAVSSRRIVTVEEHNVLGGLGGAVAEVVASLGLPARVVRHGMNDVYAEIGPPKQLYEHYGLDAAGIAAVVRDAMRASRAQA
jgi:transketolase